MKKTEFKLDNLTFDSADGTIDVTITSFLDWVRLHSVNIRIDTDGEDLGQDVSRIIKHLMTPMNSNINIFEGIEGRLLYMDVNYEIEVLHD